MRILRGLVCALLLVLCGRSFGSAPQATFAFGDALRDGGWEAVYVTVDVPSGGGVLWVRDGRGGLEIGRPVNGGAGQRVLVSLPLLAAEGLRQANGTSWSLRVGVAGSTRDLPETQGLTITRAAENEPQRALRIAVVAGAGRGPVNVAALHAVEPFALATVPESEILSAPPLCLAGCDAVFVDDALAGAMSPERAAELMACGVRLIYSGASVPGRLAEFTWAALPESLLRVAPMEYAALGPPRVIEPTLAQLKIHPPVPSGGLRSTLLVLTPAVVVLVLLVRAFASRAGVIVGVLAVGMIGGAVLAIKVVQNAAEPSIEQISWQTRQAPGNLLDHETVTFRGALFGESAEITSADPVPPIPLASDPAVWLSAVDGRLLLDTQGGGGPRVARFTGLTQPRRTRAFISRSAERGYPLPASGEDPLWKAHQADHHVDLAKGFDIAGSQVRTAGAAEGEVITSWMGHQPAALRREIEVWYQFRFDPRRRYHIEPMDAGLFVVDFGASEGH